MDTDIFQRGGLKTVGSYISRSDTEKEMHSSFSKFAEESKLFQVVKYQDDYSEAAEGSQNQRGGLKIWDEP